jgi:hypothetical protein
VPATAREAGIRWPVAPTAAAWAQCVVVPPRVLCQDEAGRLWDVLWLLACGLRGGSGGPEVPFGVHVRNDNRNRTTPLVRLKALCSPADQSEPVVTSMLPDQVRRAGWDAEDMIGGGILPPLFYLTEPYGMK